MHLHVSLLVVILPAFLVVILSPENVLAGNKKPVVAGNNKPVLAGTKPAQTGQTSNTNARPQAVFIPNNKIQNLKPSGKQRKDIESIIARLDSKCLRENARSCVDSEGNIRLDMQGRVNRDNIQCCNKQIQLNGERKPGKSSSFVVVVVPITSNIKDVQQALRKSLQEGIPYDLYYR